MHSRATRRCSGRRARSDQAEVGDHESRPGRRSASRSRRRCCCGQMRSYSEKVKGGARWRPTLDSSQQRRSNLLAALVVVVIIVIVWDQFARKSAVPAPAPVAPVAAPPPAQPPPPAPPEVITRSTLTPMAATPAPDRRRCAETTITAGDVRQTEELIDTLARLRSTAPETNQRLRACLALQRRALRGETIDSGTMGAACCAEPQGGS